MPMPRRDPRALCPIEGSSRLVGYRWEEGVDRGVGTLVLGFVGGAVWGYRGVPLGVLADFQMAESKGSFFHRVILPRFEAERLDEVGPGG